MLQTVSSQPETPRVLRGKFMLRLARSSSDLFMASEIVTEDYCRNGVIADSAENRQRIYEEIQAYRQCIAWKGTEAVATLGFVNTLRLPMDNLFGKQLEAFRAKGLRVAEMGKFGSRGRCSAILLLMSAVYQLAAAESDVVVIRVRKDDCGMYKGLGFDLLHPEPVVDPSVNNIPAYGMYVHTHEIKSARQSPLRPRIFVS